MHESARRTLNDIITDLVSIILSNKKLYLCFYLYDIQCRIFLYIPYARYYKLN